MGMDIQTLRFNNGRVTNYKTTKSNVKAARPAKRQKIDSSKVKREGNGSNQPTPTHFRFFDLPKEIRDMIYRQHFELTPGAAIRYLPVDVSTDRPRRSVLLLLETCKQIYFEAYHLFYVYNKLAFKSTLELYFFLVGVGYARRQHISQIQVRWGWEPESLAKEAFRLLRRCGRCSVLRLTLANNPKALYPAMPDSVAALREVRGLESIYVAYDLFGPANPIIWSPVRYVPRLRLLSYLPPGKDKIDLFHQKPLHIRRSEPQLLSGT